MASQAILGTKGVLSGAAGAPVGVLGGSVASCQPRPQILRRFCKLFSTLHTGAWVGLDLVLLMVGMEAGYRLFVDGVYPPLGHVPMWQAGVILVSTFVFGSLVFGLYDRETLLSRSRILTRTMLTTVAAAVVTYAVINVLMYTALSRRVMGVAMASTTILGGMIRLFACYALHRVRRSVVIVGPGILSRPLVRAFQEGLLREHRLVGYVDDTTLADGRSEIDDVRFLGSVDYLSEICRENEIDDIVIGADPAADSRVINKALPCLRRGCRVTNEATFYEKATGQVLVDEITPHWFLFADLQVHCQRRQALKRAFDLVFSVFGFLLALPLLPLIALLIKLDDGGPVFYSQTRVGENGREFRLFKFRTMNPFAETNEAVWAVKNDPRVTRAGRLLRRTRLDELPQLYNVLIGQMSLIGPRPERPDFVVKLCEHIPYFGERHLVKPGITGWAQIGFRYGSSFADAKRKLQFDLYYIKNMSLELDIMILLRTLGVFVRGAC